MRGSCYVDMMDGESIARVYGRFGMNCGVEEVVKHILRWFGHSERMGRFKMTKGNKDIQK